MIRLQIRHYQGIAEKNKGRKKEWLYYYRNNTISMIFNIFQVF